MARKATASGVLAIMQSIMGIYSGVRTCVCVFNQCDIDGPYRIYGSAQACRPGRDGSNRYWLLLVVGGDPDTPIPYYHKHITGEIEHMRVADNTSITNGKQICCNLVSRQLDDLSGQRRTEYTAP